MGERDRERRSERGREREGGAGEGGKVRRRAGEWVGREEEKGGEQESG